SVVYTVCAVVLLVAALVSGTPLSGFAADTWLFMVLMALGPQIGGHTTFNFLLRDIDATVVAVAVMAEPVGASLLALLLFGEVPPAVAIVGGAVILAGIYIAVTAGTRRQLVPPVE
ncbi:MAG TPA: EamA family transporter, partial [Actinomycetota bacterium]|nr:EamA family transporter [Actinomycetota bacterium]